ncbi:MAG: methyltransferase, partial [Mycobacteriales bacterium]
LQPSADRVEPPCPHAGPGRCGGCDWQHAAPAAQRVLKAAVIAEQLARLGGRDDIDVTVEEVPGGSLGWRTRVRFAVAADGTVGLHRHRSHEVEPVARCPLVTDAVDEIGVSRRRWPEASTVDVVVSSGGDRALVVTPQRDADVSVPPLDVDDVAVLQGRPRGGAAQRVRGHRAVRETAVGRTFRAGAGGFWQVHPAGADLLAAAVLEALSPKPGESALDLYAGVGLFAGALASALGPGGRLTLVESDGEAARDATYNLREEAPQVIVEAGRVERVLARLAPMRADLVVLDPPRSGAGATVVGQVAGCSPRAVAYVACDPAALGRDVATFAQHGYRLTGLRAFDLFPMTHHVECVALFVPAPSSSPPAP